MGGGGTGGKGGKGGKGGTGGKGGKGGKGGAGGGGGGGAYRMIRNSEGKMKRVASDVSGVDESANNAASTRPVKAAGVDKVVVDGHRANWHGGPGRPSMDAGSDSDDTPLLSLAHMTKSANQAAVTGLKHPRVHASPSAGEGGGADKKQRLADPAPDVSITP